jgi:DNA-binding MarR family transcriptional regulator
MDDIAGASSGPSAEITIPGLLGAALRAYASAMGTGLDRAGFQDMPRTGYRVVGRLARGSSSLQDIASELAMSKQAAGQLVDALVAKGYCTRMADPEDRRRVVLRLTDHGCGAARAIRDAIIAVDQTLADQVSRQDLAATRRVLTALADLGRMAGWPGAAAVAGHAQPQS